MKMSKLSKRALYRHRVNDSTLLQVPNRLKDPQATILQKNQSMTHPLQQIQSKQQMKQSKNHIFLYVLTPGAQNFHRNPRGTNGVSDAISI